MPVTVLITRELRKDCIPEAFEVIVKLRSLATLEPGYISGQTMVSVKNPNKIVVMSTLGKHRKMGRLAGQRVEKCVQGKGGPIDRIPRAGRCTQWT